MDTPRHYLFSVPFDDLPADALDGRLAAALDGEEALMVVTPNPEMLLRARKDDAFAEVLRGAGLSLPDGIGVRYAVAALTDGRLAHRHTGVDALARLIDLCGARGRRLLLLGGGTGNADALARSVHARFPGMDVLALNPGIVPDSGRVTLETLEKIRAFRPDAVAVALGAGKQERFLALQLAETGAKVGIGVGGAFEMLSGAIPRAPRAFRRLGLEWLWRLVREPRRAGRIWQATVVFPAVVAYTAWRKKRLISACKRVLREVARQPFL